MDAETKVKLISLLIDGVIKNGIPAIAKIVSNLQNKKKITAEDIDALRIDLESEHFFEE